MIESPQLLATGLGAVAVLGCGAVWWIARRARRAQSLPTRRMPNPTHMDKTAAYRQPHAIESSDIRLYQVTGLTGLPSRYIGIFCGDIRRARCADVWVNSENTDMQMARFNEFSVSSIIRYEGAVLDEAGRAVDDCIATELASRLDGAPVPPGTAITTGPGELRRHGVRRIVHVAAVHGEPGAGFRQIREVGRCVTNALTALDRIEEHPPLSTVLFPLLGVGHGGGDLDSTVTTMTGAAADYFTATPGSHITIVYFLAYADVELAACVRAFATHQRLRITNTDPTDALDHGTANHTVEPIERTEAADTSAQQLHPATTRPDTSPLPTRKALRMGFVVDVVGYGARPSPVQEAVQNRLFRLVGQVLSDCGLGYGEVDREWTGDGVNVFLPSTIDPTTTLPSLVTSVARQLGEDNRLHDDRIRLRMAVGIGVVGPGATGFAGSMVLDINRLVDSAPLRTAIAEHLDADVAILLSDNLYNFVVRPGYPGLPAADLHVVDIAVKEFQQAAWLWIPPAPSSSGTNGE